MERGSVGEPKVKPITKYLKESIKFYDMDKPIITQIVFVIELAVLFLGYGMASPYIQKVFIYYEQIVNKMQGQLSLGSLNFSVLNSDIYSNMIKSFATVIIIMVVIKSVSFLISVYFGTQYFFSLTRPELTVARRTALFFARLPKIILFNIIFCILFYISVFLLLIAVGIASVLIPFLYMISFLIPITILAFQSLFVFKDLLLVEFDTGIVRNFRKSLDLTRSNKRNIIINMLWPYSIGWLFSVFAMDVNNALLSIFIASFLEVIMLMTGQRLSVLMFLDAASIERKSTGNTPVV